MYNSAEQRELMTLSPANFQVTRNPTEETICRYLEYNPYYICKIPEPTYNHQLALLPHKCGYLDVVKNIDKRIQYMMLDINPSNIRNIQNPDKDIQLYAVKKDTIAIKYIKNMDISVQNYVVQHYERGFRDIRNIDHYIHRLAALLWGAVFNAWEFIKTPEMSALHSISCRRFISYRTLNPDEINKIIDRFPSLKKSIYLRDLPVWIKYTDNDKSEFRFFKDQDLNLFYN